MRVCDTVIAASSQGQMVSDFLVDLFYIKMHYRDKLQPTFLVTVVSTTVLSWPEGIKIVRRIDVRQALRAKQEVRTSDRNCVWRLLWVSLCFWPEPNTKYARAICKHTHTHTHTQTHTHTHTPVSYTHLRAHET